MFQHLPSQVTINEVGPRDGFQNVQKFIPTADKIAIVEKLIAAGVKNFELTSFVSPKAIPQLADASEVCRAILAKHGDSIHTSALVPNLRGAQSAWEAGIREVACVISVSASHNRANINRTHDESIADLAKMIDTLPEMKIRVDLATAFACPFEGWTPLEAVAALTRRIHSLGIRQIVLRTVPGKRHHGAAVQRFIIAFVDIQNETAPFPAKPHTISRLLYYKIPVLGMRFP